MSKSSPEGIEDLELGFLERGGLSSAPSPPPEGAGGGGEEERWWCRREGEEGGEEERTGCDADLVCSGCRRELGRGFDGLAGEVGRERGEG